MPDFNSFVFEKIEELILPENMQNSNDTAEFMKHEIQVMQDKVRKAEDNQYNLLEIIKKKGILFFNMKICETDID